MLFFHPAKIHTHTETEVNGGVFKSYVVFFWGGSKMAPNLSFTGVLDGYGMKSPFPGGFLCRRRNSNAQG